MGNQTRCPHCHSANVITKTEKVRSGNTVKAALGITAAVGAALLTATAAPVAAPFVALFGAKGVEHMCHIAGHRAAEAGKDEYRTYHVCKNCGCEF